MGTMKKIMIWLLILIGIFILSDFLINVGLNSNYKDITREDENNEIVVYQAEATGVNGRIRGIIKNVEEIQGEYLEVELYSKRDVLLDRKYIEIQKSEEELSQPFEILFRANNVASYKINIVNEK
jgi:hypothetical protein